MDEDKRDCILKAAVRAFSRMGFRKTSIDEVALEAGVGKGTIYLAVSSKDELFLSAVEREVKGFLAAGRRLIGAFDDAVDLLAGLLTGEMREAIHRPLVRQLLVGQTLATVPAGEHEVDRLQTLARGNLVSALERLRDALVVREDLEIDVVGRMLQDMEIAALIRLDATTARGGRREPGERDELAGTRVVLSANELGHLDWRRPVSALVRGLRRPLTLTPALPLRARI